MSRTTLEIEEKLLKAAMRLSGGQDQDRGHRANLARARAPTEIDLLWLELGSFEQDLDPEELRRLRRAG